MRRFGTSTSRTPHNIYGYVRSIVRDDHEAEDVTQHVFAKLMTTVVKYDDRGVPFFAWLIRLARNVAIDHLRANRLTPTEAVFEPVSPSGLDLDRGETMRAALAALPDEQREVVLLRHVLGLTPGEIAEAYGSHRELDSWPAPPGPPNAATGADAPRIDAQYPSDGATARRGLTRGLASTGEPPGHAPASRERRRSYPPR